MKTLKFFFISLLFSQILLYAQDFWEATNGPYGALVSRICMNSNGDLFAGSNGQGIFRSTDNGDNWTPANNGLISSGIRTLAINSNGHLFTGTRDGYGMFRSTNNGESWTAVNNGLTNSEITCCAVNLQDHIFAGSASGNGGLFRSTNNGDNWTQIGFENKDVYRIAFDELGNVFVTTLGDGVFRSTDNGGSWDEINNGLTSLVTLGIGFNAVGDIFAGTFDGTFRSSDSGSNWVLVDSTLLALFFEINSGGDMFAIRYLNPGYSMSQSIDDGLTWTDVDVSEMDSDPVSVYIAANDDVFIAAWSGVYFSADNAQTLIKKTQGMLCGVLSFCSNSSDYIFAGSNGIGVFRSEDNGLNWTYINNGIAPDFTNRRIYALSTNSNDHIFFASYGGVYRSTDIGENWVEVNNGLLDDHVQSISINSNDIIYASIDAGVFRSTDNGENWTEINNGITGNPTVVCFAINSNDDVFASTHEHVYRSTNDGNNWTEIRPYPFDCLAINSNDYIFGGTDFDGISISTDNGNNWNHICDTLPTTSLAINSLDHIFSGNDSTGIFRSTDNGNTWIQINSGLTNTKVLSLAIDLDDYIFAGIQDGGVFRSSESTITSVFNTNKGIPASFELEQNYPNPFNPSTRIKYAIGSRQFVSLKVYDVLGNEIATLVNEEKSAGSYEVDFDASKLTSGVYFYQLKAGKYIETKKMLLLR